MSLRNRAVILGVGESDIGKHPHMSGLGLNAQAAKRAIADAGMRPSDIDGLLTAYSFTEPYVQLGTVMAEYLGLKPRFCSSMILGGASPGGMLHYAALAVANGECNAVLVCAGENRATGMTRDEAVKALSAVGHPYFEAPYGASIPSFYGLVAARYMHERGLTREQLASVAVNTRYHASLNPVAHMRERITIEDVMNSKAISSPLNVLDCCLISDAGGAYVVTTPERAKDFSGTPVYLLGIGEHHTHEHLICAPSLVDFGAQHAGRRAYTMAGLGPSDIDVAEIYDCFTIVPIIEMEELGLCEPGEAGSFFLEGHARVGGKLPINTHGGMLSHAHAGAVGGLMSIIEAVRQVRGEAGERQVKGAEVALVHNEGGILSSHCTSIFAAQPR